VKQAIISAGGGAQFVADDVSNVEFQVKLTEKTVQQETDKKLNQITELYRLKSDLQAKAGVEELKKSLGRISYQGYYAVVVPIPADKIWSITNDGLKTAGRPQLASQAISSLNGTFISSLTSVANAVLLTDYIKAVNSGSMAIAGDDIQERITSTTGSNFLWVVKKCTNT